MFLVGPEEGTSGVLGCIFTVKGMFCSSGLELPSVAFASSYTDNLSPAKNRRKQSHARRALTELNEGGDF